MAACTLDVTVPPMREGNRATAKAEPACGDGEPSGGDRNGIPAFRLFDPFKRAGPPWLTPGEIAALDNPVCAPGPFAQMLPPDEPLDARGVCRRINALRRAMEDLDGQALRLARWRAGRHRETCRPRRWSPMRPGRPPGWRKHTKTPVGEVLRECHALAMIAWNAPDTS